MKVLFFSLPLLVLLGIANPVLARDMAIGLSPYQEPASAKTQVKSVLQFMTENLEPGESCLIFDAFHIRSLGTFKVPNKPTYRHKKAKLQANRKVVKRLLQWAQQAHEPKGSNEPSSVEAIRLPQALRFIGENYPAGKESDLILLGSPIYDDPKEKDFTMTRNHIPGDGHLTKARSVTPYGIKGQASLLAKRQVHLGFSDESWKQDDHHGYFVHRFWSLHIEGQGGVLSTFISDLPTLFQRVKNNAPSPKHGYELEHTDKLEMILLRPPVVKHQLSIYERPLSTTPLASELLRQAPNVEIGMTWDCGECDLDLYARNGSATDPLSFLNTQSPEGHFWKDWMRSPLGNAYETVTYHVPVDLEQLFLAANFYGGKTSEGVRVKLRVSIDGQTYAKSFHIQASAGNGGNGRKEILSTGQAVSSHWIVIDPLEVIGFDGKTQSLARR